MDFGLELALVGLVFAVGALMFFLYIKASPDVDIPKSYFFKEREASIRKRRHKEAEQKSVQVDL